MRECGHLEVARESLSIKAYQALVSGARRNIGSGMVHAVDAPNDGWTAIYEVQNSYVVLAIRRHSKYPVRSSLNSSRQASLKSPRISSAFVSIISRSSTNVLLGSR